MHRINKLFKIFLGKIATRLWIIIVEHSLFQEPIRGDFNENALRNLMSRLYQNPAMQGYLDSREEALIHNAMLMYVKGDIPSTDRFAGQLYEIQKLRVAMRACYIKGTKGQQQKLKKFLSDRKREQTLKSEK